MSRRIPFAVAIIVAVALAMGMGVGPVVAQEDTAADRPEENATAELEDEAATEADTLENQEPIRFGTAAEIVGWEFDGGEVVVAIESEQRNEVTISDGLAGVGKDGAVTIPKTTHTLERGETTIVRMPVTEYRNGHSVSVSIDGAAARLSSAMSEGANNENPFNYFGGESGLFSGMGLSMLMAGIAALWVLKKEDKGVIKA